VRLSKFGRVRAIVSLVYVAAIVDASIGLHRPSFNLGSVPLLVAPIAFFRAAAMEPRAGPAQWLPPQSRIERESCPFADFFANGAAFTMGLRRAVLKSLGGQ
jgi:hypothetical protein